MEKEIITRTSKIWLGEDGIIRWTCLPLKEEVLADAIENVEAASKISKDKKSPLLVDLRNLKSVDRKARAYYAGDEAAKVFRACVLLIDSPISKIIGNIFLNFNKPKYPVKLFTSETDAIEWLKGFVE